MNSNELTLSAADFPVKTSATLGSEPALTESVQDSGANTSGSFAFYDPASCLWKTWQRYLDGDLAPYSATWPRAGTMRNGTAFQRPPLAPLTAVTDFSLLPTPSAAAAKQGQNAPDGRRGQTLVGAARGQMWPTPRASDGMTHALRNPANIPNGDPNGRLEDVVVLRQYYPTPTASPWRSGKSSEATHERNSRPLNEVAAQGQARGYLNPDWIEWLMGFPVEWTALED